MGVKGKIILSPKAEAENNDKFGDGKKPTFGPSTPSFELVSNINKLTIQATNFCDMIHDQGSIQ